MKPESNMGPVCYKYGKLSTPRQDPNGNSRNASSSIKLSGLLRHAAPMARHCEGSIPVQTAKG